MATKALLADLSQLYQAQTGVEVQILSVGGVDAAKRVQAGETLDMVLLASDAIDRLLDSGHAMAGSRHDWVRSPVAVAVPAGVAKPDVGSEQALKAAVLSSPSLSYSTGPSGVYLEQLFARWGIAEQVKSRVVVPPPGTPVGALLASCQVALGFQQMSELMGVAGIEVLGTLPNEVAYITTFSSAVPAVIAHDATRVQAVQAFLNFLSSADVEEVKRRQGMEWL